MKRAFIVIVIIGGAFLGYRYYDRSGPDAQYKKFAEAVLHRQYDAAAAMTEGLSSGDLQRSGTQEKIGAGPEMFQTLFPSRFQIETREKAADGTLTLTAIQTVLFNPPGVESAARPAMYAKMNQTVTMRKSGGAWKVVAFDNKFGSMDSLTRR